MSLPGPGVLLVTTGSNVGVEEGGEQALEEGGEGLAGLGWGIGARLGGGIDGEGEARWDRA